MRMDSLTPNFNQYLTFQQYRCRNQSDLVVLFVIIKFHILEKKGKIMSDTKGLKGIYLKNSSSILELVFRNGTYF